MAEKHFRLVENENLSKWKYNAYFIHAEHSMQRDFLGNFYAFIRCRTVTDITQHLNENCECRIAKMMKGFTGEIFLPLKLVDFSTEMDHFYILSRK